MKDIIRKACYTIAAIPALFLTFAYLITIAWLIVYALPAAYRGDPNPEPGKWFYSISHYGMYALAIQWPLYLGWAALTRDLTARMKALWIGVLLVFNVFAMPWFLYAKFQDSVATEPMRFIRRRSARRFFAKGLVQLVPAPLRFHSDLPMEYRRVRFLCKKEDLPPEFRVITAWNPQGEILEDAVNTAADEHLRSEIQRLGFDAFPVTGGNEDFSHAEPGYGVVCDRTDAVLLARRFRQKAFYEVLDHHVYLVPVEEGHLPGDLIGSWSELLSDSPLVGES